MAHALKVTRMHLIAHSDRELTPDELGPLRELVKRRRRFEPIAYLRGEREFYGRVFKVDRRVLVPRPDTEALVEVALNRTALRSLSMRALDICTGSGCVGITLARQRPTGKVVLTDVSADALVVARENALRLGAYNLTTRHGDLFAAVAGLPMRFDVVTANPPYIPSAEIATLAPDVREHEPRLALDGGADGLDFVRRIVVDAPRVLEADGLLAMEIGFDEAPATSELFRSAGYRDVRVARDYAGIDRVVSGVRPVSG